MNLSLRPLVQRRQASKAACDEWHERGWENVPAEVVQESLDSARAIVDWVEQNTDALLADPAEIDDAIHIAAPWEKRSSLCGQWERRNLALLDGPRPDGASGCWTCLMAASWIDVAVARAALGGCTEMPDCPSASHLSTCPAIRKDPS